MAKGPCEVEGCEAQAERLTYCHKHYSRMRRYGDPFMLKRATSTPGKDAVARAEYVRRYKMKRGCVDCGYRKHPAALDFDHRPGTTKIRDIKRGQQLGWAALMEEIAKCDVVCANCHRIRTAERREEVVRNGYVVH